MIAAASFAEICININTRRIPAGHFTGHVDIGNHLFNKGRALIHDINRMKKNQESVRPEVALKELVVESSTADMKSSSFRKSSRACERLLAFLDHYLVLLREFKVTASFANSRSSRVAFWEAASPQELVKANPHAMLIVCRW
jgi:hypothetical protein